MLAALAAAAAVMVIIGGEEVSVVAALRTMQAPEHIGWVIAIWALGSIVGALVYGAWHRSVSVFWLLGGLAAATLPVAFAGSLPVLAVLMFVSGLFCAPSVTATVDTLSRAVPEAARGEAMGWHASSMTAGMAFGAPLAGFAIDRAGWGAGFLWVSGIGLLIAGCGAGLTAGRASFAARCAAAPTDAPALSLPPPAMAPEGRIGT